jgi:phage recombination protein Bet
MNALQKVEPINNTPSMGFDNAQINLLKTTICKGATDDELKFFIYACQRTGLDPFARQIYSVPRGGQRVIQTSVDGFRLIADRSGRYAPGRETTFTYDKDGNLISATAYVKKQTRDGTWHEVSANARYDEYDGKNNFWKTKSHIMLSKCAECLALRKAFPAEMSGIYGKEEMDQAEADSNVKPLYMEIISLDHAKELQLLLNECSEESQKAFLEYIKKAHQTESVEGIPEKEFEKIKKILIKKRDEHQKMLVEKEMTINVVKDEE